jgi:hypothetical protein
MSVKDDLIAARALIDTPEKLDAVGSVREACNLACGDDTREGRLRAAEIFGLVLAQPGDPNAVPATDGNYLWVSYRSIIPRLDRAIEAAE